MFLFLFVSTLLGFTSINANVIGIDFGSDNIKIGMISPGKFDIVTNFQSKRRTPNNLAFYQGERFYGSDAYALMARKPEVVFSKFFRIIGKSTTNPRILELVKQYFPYQIFANESTKLTSIKFEDNSYTPEELLAMMMSHIKEITKDYSGAAVKDCVITVPSSFTQHEKNALLTAAEIADLNVLSLIEENTAAALHFGIDRTFDEPHNVLYYNMGSGQVQVSIVTYSSFLTKDGSKNKTNGQFQVVGKAWDEEIGGFNFDLLLAELLATRFNENWQKKKSGVGKDIRDFNRPMTRLRMDALKIREILSANNEYPYKVEQLHADVDLSTKITRQEFEEISRDLLSRITNPIDRALAMANLTLKDIHAVELLGGSVRMPIVKHTLEAYFKTGDLELGQHLNGDEAMALGATFRAANISTAFRVRKVGITDLLPFGVSVKFDNLPTTENNGGLFNWLLGNSNNNNNKPKSTESNDEVELWSKHTPLFPPSSPIPSKTKTVAFHHDKNILCRVEYDQNESIWSLPTGVDSLISVLNITGIAEFAQETSSLGAGQPKIHLSFTLDNSGIITLSKAEATLELPESNNNNNTTNNNNNNTSGDNNDVNEGNETKTSESIESETTTTTDSTQHNETSSTDSKEKSTDKKDSKKNTKKSQKKEKKDNILRKTLIVTINNNAINPPIWSNELINNAKNRLRALDEADASRKEKAAALNDLEGYVYKIRNRIRDEEDQLKVISTTEQRDDVIELCNTVEEWLYDEGKNQEVSVYKSKQNSIKSKAEAIFKRFKEHTARPEAIKKATHQLSAIKQLVGEWEETMPQITTEEKDKLLEVVKRVESWIEDNKKTQSTLTAFEQPAFTSTDVQNQLKPLTAQLDKLLKKPKPVPPKNTTETNSTTSQNNSTSSTDNTSSSSSSSENTKEEPETIRVHTEDPESEKINDEL